MFYLVSTTSCTTSVHLQAECGSSFSVASDQVLVDSNKVSPLCLLFLRLDRPSSLSLSLCVRCSSPLTVLADLLHHVHIFLVLRIPELGTSETTSRAPCQLQEQSHLPWPTGHTLTYTVQEMAVRLGCKSALLPSVIHQDPQVLLCRATSQALTPTSLQRCSLGLFHPRSRTFQFTKFLSAHFLGLPRSLWIAVLPSNIFPPMFNHPQTCLECTSSHHPGH